MNGSIDGVSEHWRINPGNALERCKRLMMLKEDPKFTNYRDQAFLMDLSMS